MENTRKKLHCKGTVPHTSAKCRTELCETDGETIYIKMDSGNEMLYRKLFAVNQHDTFRFICENCGFVNVRRIKKDETN